MGKRNAARLVAKNFTLKFEEMLATLILKHSQKNKTTGNFEIPVLEKNLVQTIQKDIESIKDFCVQKN